MKRLTLAFSLLMVFSLLLAACAPAAATPAAQPITLTDGLGREIKLAKPAQRIVSLAPSNTEILFAIGAGAQVVGRDEFTNYPEEAKTLPSVGGSMGNYNLEAIVALKPDLVLAAQINTPEMVKSLEDLGLTVYYLSNPTDLEGMYSVLETAAKLTGRETAAADLVKSLRERVAAVEKAVAGAATTPKVFYELDGSDPAKPWTTGPGTFLNTLVQKAGGVNVAANLGSDYGQMSLEELLVQNPDIILLGDAAYGTTVESVAARAGWDAIKAVAEGRIETFNDDLVSRPGPRLVDGLETLAKLLHPELFK